MFQSILGKLNLGGKSNRSTARWYTSPMDNNSLGDREEDGFTMIGETASERTAVVHKDFMMRQGNHAPPNYSNVVTEDPPLYKTISEVKCTAVSLSELSPLTDNMHKTPVTDVPFDLSPYLTLLNRLDVLDGQDCFPTHFDSTKYNYDFQLELDYLQEIGSPYEPHLQTERPSDLIQL